MAGAIITNVDYCYQFIKYLIKENKLVGGRINKEHARTIYKASFKPSNPRRDFSFFKMYITLQRSSMIKYDKKNLIFKKDILHKIDPAAVNNAIPSPAINSVTNLSITSRQFKPSTPPTKAVKCIPCKVVLANETIYRDHQKTDRHILVNRFVNHKKILVNPIANLIIEIEENHGGTEEVFLLRTNEKRELLLNIKNTTGIDYTITEIIEMTPNDFITLEKRNELPLINSTQTTLKINVHFFNVWYASYPLILRMKQTQSNTIVDVLKELVFRVYTTAIDELRSKEPYIKTKISPIVPITGTVRGTHMKRGARDFAPSISLQQYTLSDDLIGVLNNDLNDFDGMNRRQMTLTTEIRDVIYRFNIKSQKKLNESNYYEMLRLLLFMEEHQMKIEIKKYSLDDCTLLKAAGFRANCLELKVAGLAERRPSLLRGDSVYVTEDKDSRVKYEGIVHQVQQDGVILGFSNKFMKQIHIDNKKYYVQFGFNRVTIRAEHQAINLINDHRAISILCKTNFQERELKNHQFVWFNKNLANNEQQQQAVKHILSETARPMPYLVFGPPGTGKTVTIVEAVLQVWKLLPTKNILVCAPSNNAADEVAKRLAAIVPKRDMMRYVAPSYPYELIYTEVKPFVNYRDGDYYHPPNTTILTHRIVVTTLVNSVRLVNGGTPKGHFEFVFIDESGQATESETLIPIAGILTSNTTKGAINGQIVLAGDPKQLGPIIHSPKAMLLGFDISMLERLMKYNTVYQKNEKGKFNPASVTKLIQCYRSHPEIIAVSNNLFYENELMSAAEKNMTHIAVGWEHLPNPTFPVIFHSVFGKDERESTSPSFFNVEEIDVVLSYLNLLIGTKMHGMKISEEHIGIIAPYRKQVYKLGQACSKKHYGEKLFIGSVEQFQGQERLIIILSTVRSRAEYTNHDTKFHLGFLTNPKRFNVGITRAKALLIVIGNPTILLSDPNWYAFIKHCNDNGSVRGAPFSLEPSITDLTIQVASLQVNDDLNQLDNVEDGPTFTRGII